MTHAFRAVPILLLCALIDAEMLGAQSASGASLVLPASAPTIRLQRAASIGAATLNAGRIVSIVADATGRVYVGDAQARTIGVFDASGKQLRTIGRAGAGPGEFQQISSLAWIGDTLAVYDGRSRQVSLFTTDGTFVRAIRWPTEIGFASFSEPILSDGATLFGVILQRPSNPARRGGGPAPAPVRRYAHLGPASRTNSLVTLADSLRSGRVGTDCEDSAGVVHIIAAPFEDRGPLRAILPGGRLIRADTLRFSLDVFDLESGALVRNIRRGVPAVPVTDSSWAADMAEYFDVQKTFRGLQCKPPLVRPTTVPAIRTVLADQDGSVWMEVSATDGIRLFVFNPGTGAIRGEARMPARDVLVAPYIRGGRLYLVSKDANDAQLVEVWTIQ